MLRKYCYRKLFRGSINFHINFFPFNCVSPKSRTIKSVMPKPGFYAVKVGKIPGIYKTWAECEKHVKGFPNAKFKKFDNLELAKNFVNGQIEPLRKTDELVKEKLSSNDIDSDIINILYDTDFLSDCDFNEDIVPVITSTSDLVVSKPKIIYPTTSKDSFYAVYRGRNPGIYKTWDECSRQIKDFNNASYRKFNTEEEALQYIKTGGIQKATKRELENLKIENRIVKKQKNNETEKNDYVLQNPDEPVVVFTDGASSENGKKRSRAGIGVYWGDNHPLNTSKRIAGRQTNNRAEIYAAVHALNQAKQIGAKKVKLYTDSQFVIHAITDWIKKWKENGWKLATGKDVVNKDDFIALDFAQKDLEVKWIYVKAHARNKGNDEADRLAVAGSNLVLRPENCSEFENFHIESSSRLEEGSIQSPFLISDSSNSCDDALHLILPNVQEKKPFYAVHRGKCPGIYSTWTDCERQIKNFLNPNYRKFHSKAEAEEFLKSGKVVKAKPSVPEFKGDEYVTVYTDGASSCNGQAEAKAGIGVYWGPDNQFNTSMRLPGRQTNNRAEIFAAVHALRQAKLLGIKNVRLYTDSKFVIDGITTWIVKWKENGWKLASGKPVINKEDFISLDDACQGLNIDWRYVKGHSDNPGNIEADKLAVAGCNKSLGDTIILT